MLELIGVIAVWVVASISAWLMTFLGLDFWSVFLVYGFAGSFGLCAGYLATKGR